MLKNLNIKISIIFILAAGILLRVYNIGFEDLWYDEIISFWVASPNHSFSDSFKIHNYIEIAPYTYHFLLKLFFKVFGYHVETGRYVSAIFSCLSILTIPYIVKITNHNKAYLLSIFLVSLNIFLISYAQEIRVYSMLLFFVSLSLLFFFKVLKNDNNFLYFISFSLIAIFLHPFALLIFFSYILYAFLRFLKFKEINLRLNISLIFIGLISVIFYLIFFYFLKQSNYNHEWIPQIDFKFYTNFFFSSFFGSRILGLIFLFFLIFLSIKNFKNLKTLDYLSVFFILIIVSYTLPIIFSYAFEPVLVPRYLIFVLIPVILLISILTYEFNSSKISFLIAFFLCIVTILNMFTEQSFKQFYKPRDVHKPEYFKALTYINKSNHKKYSLKLVDMKSIIETTNSINNYISHVSEKNNLEMIYIPLKKIDNTPFWVICPLDITGDCSLAEDIKDYQVMDEKYFNRINLKLIKNK